MLPKIIGIVGKIHSGKDTIADYLGIRHKYMKAEFADPLKYVCAELFMDAPSKFFSEEGKKEVMPYWGITRRAALQFVGTELVRNHLGKLFCNDEPESDHWIRCMEKRIQDTNNPLIVINDTRFQNELDWIYEKGGIVIHVFNDTLEAKADGGIPNHDSEDIESLVFQGEHTCTVRNESTKEDLYCKIDSIIAKFI